MHQIIQDYRAGRISRSRAAAEFDLMADHGRISLSSASAYKANLDPRSGRKLGPGRVRPTYVMRGRTVREQGRWAIKVEWSDHPHVKPGRIINWVNAPADCIEDKLVSIRVKSVSRHVRRLPLGGLRAPSHVRRTPW